jgi:anti-sigma B factor antagonist
MQTQVESMAPAHSTQLTIRTRQVRGILVMDLTGQLTIGPSLALFETSANRTLAESAPRRLILNLRELSQIDSAGLGEIMILYSAAARAKCTLVLVAANVAVRQLLRITRVDGVLKLFDDEATAISAEIL